MQPGAEYYQAGPLFSGHFAGILSALPISAVSNSSFAEQEVQVLTSILSKEQLNQYEREGIIFPVKVFSDDDVAFFRGALEAVIHNCGSPKRLDNLHLFFDWAHRLVTHEAVLNVIQEVLGSDILIYGTLVFYKPPRDKGYASWHQDALYSGLHLTPSTSAWIALSPSHAGNGCMRVIPESHKTGLLSHSTARDEANLLRRGEQIVTVDESKALDVQLRPGEMSLHQSTIVHGSNPNTSGEPRIGFIVRFITSQIQNRERAMLRVRGTADCSHLILAEPPSFGMDQQSALTAWQAFAKG
jgi:non-haem Fe2+, alpha-ketoglutarate-dependent halogenase